MGSNHKQHIAVECSPAARYNRRMMRRVKQFACMLALLGAGVAVAQPVNPLPQDDLLVYLDQLTQWQRDVVAMEPSDTNARGVVFRDSLRDNSSKALQNGFTFLRGVADAQPAFDANDPESTRAILMTRAAQMRTRMETLRGDALRIEQARYELLQTILANLNSASNKSPNKLRYTIESLSRSIPELSGEKIPKQEAKPVRQVAPSIFSVSAAIFDVTRKQREIATAIDRTAEVKKQSMEVMKMLRAGLGEEEPAQTDEELYEEDSPPVPMSTEARVEAYQRIGGLIVPLAETMRWIDASKQTLKEWSAMLQQYREQLLQQLGTYLAILIATLLLAVLLSELARRALKKINDPKRKRKLNAVRRIATGVAILFILLFNFISDFGSFATFAGFLTAGLAVALQSVLLSLVAHFLFYGRYGVRAGDRVNVAGVTGDIMQIGWVRFYLRELQETESGELLPTGKTVALPNAILFQNVAFSKYPA